MGERPYRRSLAPGQVGADERRAIREELELHIELRARELMAGGVSPAEAWRQAEERFGDAGRIEDELRRGARRRRARRGMMMTMRGFVQDVRYALRSLRTQPGFAAAALVTLALAMGGNTAIFSVVDAALLRAMPFADADDLVYVNGVHIAGGEVAIRGASYPEFYDWEERARGVRPLAAVGGLSLSLSGDGPAESVPAEIVTRSYFDVLRVSPARGRTFTAAEHADAGESGVVVLSHGLWERRYGADPDVLGRSLVLNDAAFTVVGVMPPGFGGIGLTTDVWIPESNTALLGFGRALESRGARFLSVIGRLATTPDAAQRELDVIARELQEAWPRQHEGRWARLQSFRDAYLAGTGSLLWLLFGAGLLLTLIAAANVANLLLVRAHGRAREFVLRRALGADGRRVAGQVLAESLVLALLGGAAGLALAYAGLRVLGPMIPQGVLPGYVEPALSASAFLFSLAVLGVVGVAMGLVPAVASARLDLAPALREGGQASAGGRARLRARQGFVVAQVALALTLMVGAGLMVRSFRAQLGVDVGADLQGVAAVQVSLPSARYPDADPRRRFAAEVLRRVREIPGVGQAAVSSDLPFRGGSSGAYVFRDDAPDERIRYHRHSVTPGYFATLGVELVEGRLLTEADMDGAAGVAVVTEAMVRRVFGGQSPVGRTMYLAPGADPESAFEIVGVVRDVRYRDLTTSLMADANSPDVFFTYDQLPTASMEVAVRVRGDTDDVLPLLRGAVSGIDPDLAVLQPQALRDAYRARTATPRFAALLMGTLGILALVLSCVGIYGVLAFTVAQRTREMAVRRAVGASAARVARIVVVDGLRVTLLGLGLGAVTAALGAGLLRSYLYGVSEHDPATYAGVASAMLVSAIAATVLPALRAVRCDPAEALAGE